MKEPKWLKNAVFYEIYPQSYYDTNNDGIGDLPGIIEKLDYVKDLGFNAIWFNPWYESPFRDAGYDVTDYYKIASRYGTNDDAKRLFEKAHELGLKIIIDLVMGHTSLECDWFVKSQEQEKNEYTDRYIWCPYQFWRGDPEEGIYDYYVNGYSSRGAYKTNFFYNQPALNFGYAKVKHAWEQPVGSEGPKATIAEFKNIMRFWLNMGADGFRVDMAPSLVKRDEGKKEVIKIWRDIRKMFDTEYPDAVLVSEWGCPMEAVAKANFHMDLGLGDRYYNLSRKDYYWTEPEREYKDIVFDEEGKGDITYFLKQYMEDLEGTKDKGYIGMFSGNHDVRRLSYNMSSENIKVFMAFIMTIPSIPFVYYGDEIGMRNLTGIPSKEGGDIRTEARTPMQWNNWENKGFSKGRKEDLYLPVDESEDAPTVNGQYDDPDSVLNAVKDLIKVRKANKALGTKGEFNPVYMKKNKYPFVYERVYKNKKCLVFLNPTGDKKELEIKYRSKDIKVLYRKDAEYESDGKTVKFVSEKSGILILSV